MLLSGAAPQLAVNASHLVPMPPTSQLHAFDVAGPGGAPIILAPRLPVPDVGHPPPPAPASLPPPLSMPQQSLVSFGDLPPAPMFVQFDPFIASQHQMSAVHHSTPSAAVHHHPTVPNIAYVR